MSVIFRPFILVALAVLVQPFGQGLAQTATASPAHAPELAAGWQAGEKLSFTVENIIDTFISGELGGEMHVRLRNDVRASVLELLPRGEARLALTFDRVRIEETDDEGHREMDTLTDAAEKREANPWCRIVGKPIEVLSHPGEGRLSMVNTDELVERLAGNDPQRMMQVRSLLKPGDLQALIELAKPRFPQTGASLKAGQMWKDDFNPRIPLSDIQLIGVTRVSSVIDRRIVLDSLFILPPSLPDEKRVAEQMEFKMLGARYQQVKADRTMSYDPLRKTCTDLTNHLMLNLEGKVAGKTCPIRSTQKSHYWLLEHSVESR